MGSAIDFLEEGELQELAPGGPPRIVEAPPGTTAQSAREFLKEVYEPVVAGEERMRQAIRREEAIAPAFRKGPVRRAFARTLAGIAEPMTRTATGVQALMPGVSPEALETSREQLELLEAAAPEGVGGFATGLTGELLQAAPVLGPASRGTAAVAKRLALSRAAAGKGPRLGGYGRSVAPAVAEVPVVTGMEALKLPEEGESRATAALKGAVGTAAMGLAGRGGVLGLKHLALPSGFPKTREAYRQQAALRAAGEDPFLPVYQAIGPVPEKTPGKLVRTIQTQLAPSLDVLGRPLREQIGEKGGRGAWYNMLLKRALPEDARVRLYTPRVGAGQPMKNALRDIGKFYHDEYERILTPYNIPMDRQFQREVLNAIDSVPSGEMRERVASDIRSSLGRGSIAGFLLGRDIKNVQKRIRGFAANEKLYDAESGAYRWVADSMEDMIQRYLQRAAPEGLEEYQRLARPYREFALLKEAAKRAPITGGEFTPRDLAMAVKYKKRPPATEATEALAVRSAGLYEPMPTPSEFKRAAVVGVGTAAAASPFAGLLMFGPAGLTPAGPLGAILAAPRKWSQQYMMRETPMQKWIADYLRRTRKAQALTHRGAAVAGGTEMPELFEKEE